MAEFSLARSTTIAADPARVHDLIDDFREWPDWSPWEGMDPELKRTYSGPTRGVGSHYAWQGNNKAGEGSMEITESDQSKVVIDLRFVKPFKAENISRFDLAQSGDATQVTWTMTGQRNFLMGLLGPVFFDKMIAKDFEKGLAQLKVAAES
ncbi:MAG: SRPBCC family protein [Nocardioides sp.]